MARSFSELHDRERALVSRWRLLLGKDAEQAGLGLSRGGDEDCDGAEAAQSFLFDDRDGGSGGSELTIPSWIDAVSELFPRQAREILQRELVNRKGIHKILDQPELLERIEPNVELVKSLLTHKNLLTPKTRVREPVDVAVLLFRGQSPAVVKRVAERDPHPATLATPDRL